MSEVLKLESRTVKGRTLIYPVGTNTPIAQVFSHWGPEMERQVKNLICAAPDLLAVCELADKSIRHHRDGDLAEDALNAIFRATSRASGKATHSETDTETTQTISGEPRTDGEACYCAICNGRSIKEILIPG